MKYATWDDLSRQQQLKLADFIYSIRIMVMKKILTIKNE